MKFPAIALSATLAMTLCTIGIKVEAQTVNSRCDIYPKGSDRASKVVNCTFSQRQGFVTIQRADGVKYILTPKGNQPGNYVDQNGKPAYRNGSIGGNRGQIYRLDKESVYVYWNESAPKSK